MSQPDQNCLFRSIRKEDNIEVAAIIRAVFEEFDAPKEGTVYSDPSTDDLYGLFQQKGAILWVAESEGEIIGCCGIFPTAGLDVDCAELVKFYVLSKSRGRGIGRDLMERCIESARQMGYSRIYLESLPVFSRALDMYRRAGFALIDQPLGDSGHTGCNIWMLLTLNDSPS